MGETDFDLRRIISVLRRRSRLVLRTVVAIIGIAAIFAFTQTPTYTSSALVLVDPSDKNLLEPQSQVTSSGDSARIDSEVELARSDSVLLRVIEQEHLTGDEEFAASPGNLTSALSFLHLQEPPSPSDSDALNEALARLRNALTVQRRGLTYLISIQVRSEDPTKAAHLANATANAYIHQQLGSKIDSVLTARNALQSRAVRARDALAASRDALSSFTSQGFAGEDEPVPQSQQRNTQLDELQQNADLARSQYQTLLVRSHELDTQADLQIANSRIVSPALPPQHPSSPNQALIFTLAGLLAAGASVAVAFLYENLIGGFTSQEQVEDVLRTPVAAVIPRERPQSDRGSLSDVMVQSPLSSFAESIRRARASIEQSVRSQRQGSARTDAAVLMVTSTVPCEGKTTFALSLARTYALSGHRVLLIDCDLRQPSLHRHLGWQPSLGLMDFLTAAPDSAEAIGTIMSRDRMADVTVITGTHRSDVPTDQILAGRSFERLIQAARQSFDTVILDTPPIGPVVDGLYIAPFADVICCLVRWSHTSQQEVQEGIKSLAAAKLGDATILAVLNQQDDAGIAHHRRYYPESS